MCSSTRRHARTHGISKYNLSRTLIFQSSYFRPRESERNRNNNFKLPLNDLFSRLRSEKEKCTVDTITISYSLLFLRLLLSLSLFLAKLLTRYCCRYYSLQDVHSVSQQSCFITRRLTGRADTFGNSSVINDMLMKAFPFAVKGDTYAAHGGGGGQVKDFTFGN